MSSRGRACADGNEHDPEVHEQADPPLLCRARDRGDQIHGQEDLDRIEADERLDDGIHGERHEQREEQPREAMAAVVGE
jgi:hypothetical protein